MLIGFSVSRATQVETPRRKPRIIATMPGLKLAQGSGEFVINAAAAFSGAALRFSAAGPAALRIDAVSGVILISTDEPLTETLVAVTATNEFGSATTRFHISVVALARAPLAEDLTVTESADRPGGIEVAMSADYPLPEGKGLRLYIGTDPTTPVLASGPAGALMPGGTYVSGGTWPGRTAPDPVHVALHLVDPENPDDSLDVTSPAVTIETAPVTVITEIEPPSVRPITAGQPYREARKTLGAYQTNNFIGIETTDGGVLYADGRVVEDEDAAARAGQTIDMRVTVTAADDSFALFWSDEVSVTPATIPVLSDLALDPAAGTISLASDIPCTAFWSLDPAGTDPDPDAIIAAGNPGIVVDHGINSEKLDFSAHADGDYQISLTARATHSDPPAIPARGTISILTARALWSLDASPAGITVTSKPVIPALPGLSADPSGITVTG